MISTLPRRLFLLLAMLVAGLGLVFVLPKAPQPPPPGVIMELPDFVGEWYGQNAVVTEKERQVLGKETRFARKLYTDGRGDAIYVSIVLAGEDMSTSIHRPERCLPAQGYTIIDARSQRVPIPPRTLTATRLHDMRPIYDTGGKPLSLPNGSQAQEYSLIYYWFIGSSEITSSHTTRYLMDARDRLLRGTNQSWAYVTVMSRISANMEKFGRDEAQTDAMIQAFIQKITPMIQDPKLKFR